jgi:hypothetical protein
VLVDVSTSVEVKACNNPRTLLFYPSGGSTIELMESVRSRRSHRGALRAWAFGTANPSQAVSPAADGPAAGAGAMAATLTDAGA